MSFVKLAPGSSRPLLPVASFLILAFTVFVLAGGLFILVGAGTSVSLLNVQQGLGFVYPHDINNQTPAEGVFVALLYALGIVGLYEHTQRIPAQPSIRLSRVRHAAKLRLHGNSILRAIPEAHVAATH